jgi:hypothetical protein
LPLEKIKLQAFKYNLNPTGPDFIPLIGEEEEVLIEKIVNSFKN